MAFARLSNTFAQNKVGMFPVSPCSVYDTNLFSICLFNGPSSSLLELLVVYMALSLTASHCVIGLTVELGLPLL